MSARNSLNLRHGDVGWIVRWWRRRWRCVRASVDAWSHHWTRLHGQRSHDGQWLPSVGSSQVYRQFSSFTPLSFWLI